MKQMKRNFSKLFTLGLVFSLFYACEKEFSEIGSGIVGTPNIEIKLQTYPVKTYNKRITPFQSNTLSKNLLGYHVDPIFGRSTAHILAQVTPKSYVVNFGDEPVLDSVVLTIPYTSRRIDDTTYTIDSLYGEDAVRLSVYKNDFFIRDFDPASDLDQNQSYYSDGSLSPSEQLNPAALEAQLLYESNYFLPSNEEIKLTALNSEGESETTATLAPSLRVKLEHSSLPENFWEDLIFAKEEGDELSSANNFYDYFRGLYFKVEPLNADKGHLIQLDFSSSGADVKLHYTYQSTSPTTDETTERQGTYEMSFSGARINLFENDFNADIEQEIANANTQDGDELLYLKGGEGSMAVIELFSEDQAGNNFDDFITDFKETDEDETVIKRLINEAYIEFYVDESSTASQTEFPNRVFVYDLNNNIPLIDYFLDSSVNPTTSDSKFSHLVPLSTETDDDGNEYKKYKVRLTGHLDNIVAKDSTNVKIGLLISSNVGAADMKKLQQYDEDVEAIPMGTILSPRSVILQGSNSNDELKKVKLRVYYTEPNN